MPNELYLMIQNESMFNTPYFTKTHIQIFIQSRITRKPLTQK